MPETEPGLALAAFLADPGLDLVAVVDAWHRPVALDGRH
ncbi:hypothetical protein BH18ACT1_BH18ACT1_03670 [soil metagenome]